MSVAGVFCAMSDSCSTCIPIKAVVKGCELNVSMDT